MTPLTLRQPLPPLRPVEQLAALGLVALGLLAGAVAVALLFPSTTPHAPGTPTTIDDEATCPGGVCPPSATAPNAMAGESPRAPQEVIEIPTVNLPIALRTRNWTDGAGDGSCVHASTYHLLRWVGQEEMAAWWRKNYSGGEYAERLNKRLEAAGLAYAFTTMGDETFLDWALTTRRGAGITYWPRHAVNLVHLDREWAGILDNNRPGEIIWVEREEFIARWRGYGGWAWALVYAPSPPLPYVIRR